MTEPESDDRKTFDIYHFFSRWDMLLAAAVIVILVLLGIYYFLLRPQVA